jgi:hypothetical protein
MQYFKNFSNEHATRLENIHKVGFQVLGILHAPWS